MSLSCSSFHQTLTSKQKQVNRKTERHYCHTAKRRHRFIGSEQEKRQRHHQEKQDRRQRITRREKANAARSVATKFKQGGNTKRHKQHDYEHKVGHDFP